MKILLLVSMLLFSCNSHKGIQQETQQRIINHKAFMRRLSFKGTIIEKIYCEKCQLNKYQIVISFKEMVPGDVEVGNKTFQPYYFFSLNNQLNLSVVKGLYEVTQKGLTIQKEPNTDYLIIGQQRYKLISDEKYKWIPAG